MTAPIQPAQTKYAQRQAWAPKAAAPGRPKQGQPPRGWSLRLQTCLSRFGQATEAKRLASRGLQGLAQHTQWQAWGRSAPRRAAPSKHSPLGGQRITRSEKRGGHSVPEIVKTKRKILDFGADQGHGGLQVIAFGTCHADLALLD